jgi:galactokinase
MSNSAANCVALGLVFNAMFPALALDSDIKLVTFARSAENSRFAGGHCGWLDQLLIVCSKASKLTKIDYADNSVQHFESRLPPHVQFVALNTNVPHVLAESDYTHRVRELTLGITFLSNQLDTNAGGPNLKLGSINALLNVLDPAEPGNAPIDLTKVLSSKALTESLRGEMAEPLGAKTLDKVKKAIVADFAPPSDLPMHKGKTAAQSFAVILRRMRHQKMSSLLVPLAGEAVARGDVALFGALLDLEGKSLRMSGDFMITGDNGAQDALLDCAFAAGAELKLMVHGRMLGGGGGGNVLLLVDSSDAAKLTRWEESTKKAYQAWAESKFPGKGIKATTIVPAISAGARLV